MAGEGRPGQDHPTFSEKADDAAACVDYLQSRTDIDAQRVGVRGFSNGSWVAPMVAARRRSVAFVCVIGASGTTAVEIEIHRRAFDLREHGVPNVQIEWVRQMWRIILALLLSHEPDAEHEGRYDELSARVRASGELAAITVQEYAIQSPFLGSLPPYASYRQLIADLPNRQVDTDEWNCDPTDFYRLISVPVCSTSWAPATRTCRRWKAEVVDGAPGFLDDVRAQLTEGKFRPLPVRERKILKPGGSGKCGSWASRPSPTGWSRRR